MPFANPAKQQMDQEMNRLYVLLATQTPDSPEYKDTLKIITTFETMKAPTRPKRLSRDTIFQGAVQLGLALVVVAWESKHVWTSKVPLQFGNKSKG